ncbi:bis(5'-nucleosyl)-tetraphosphatase PrpE [asymmetrical]-like [Styela clava]
MTALIAYCISLLARRLSTATSAQKLGQLEPAVKHRTLSYLDFKGRDLFIVGDVHGCFDEAMELIDIVKKKNNKKFVTIFVGDMVNKGPKNIEMLDFIMKNKDIHCIRGNHEQAVLRSALKYRSGEKESNPKWANSWAKHLSNGQFEFLRNLPYTISIPILNIIIVHGGLHPHYPLNLQDEHNMLHMRSLSWVKDDFHGQKLVATSRHEGTLWAQCWQGTEHVYFGHDAVKKLQIESNCTGLDTGCLYGGKLTGVLLKIPENITAPLRHFDLPREFYSVDAKEAYIPVD